MLEIEIATDVLPLSEACLPRIQYAHCLFCFLLVDQRKATLRRVDMEVEEADEIVRLGLDASASAVY